MQNRDQLFNNLSLAIAYLLGGIFLCTADGAGLLALLAHIIGWVFIGFAFFLVIVSLLNRFIAWAHSIHMYLFFALFVATLGRLIIMAVVAGKPLYIVLVVVFSLLLVLALLVGIIRDWVNWRRESGSRVATVRILRIASVVLGLWAFVTAVFQINLVGGPIPYLALGLVFLSVASLL